MLGFGASRLRTAAFVRIGTDPVAHAWTGTGRFRLPADGVVTNPDKPFLGIGGIQNLPGLRNVGDDQAVRLTFTMSGVDARMRELVEAADAIGASFDLGFAVLDRKRQLVGPVMWRINGEVEMTGDSIAQASDDPTAVVTHTQSVSLTVIVGDGARRTASLGLWTATDLGRNNPTDRGYDQVSRYGPDATRPWPPG